MARIRALSQWATGASRKPRARGHASEEICLCHIMCKAGGRAQRDRPFAAGARYETSFAGGLVVLLRPAPARAQPPLSTRRSAERGNKTTACASRDPLLSESGILLRNKTTRPLPHRHICYVTIGRGTATACRAKEALGGQREHRCRCSHRGAKRANVMQEHIAT
jgi:hypothetical protein